ncbi:hypothetical protein PMAYCL1PPCAC_31032 [Pristionchus mayeri]|uniref:Fungal lipase-type domain-containing protein n=1 Tax=Pristionchus mayeri TaxID=1317129 RepID=A0AAN5IC72_9BILA|nr:hypothetical protein PMAYCL1PPCAC_31032 [Pristionchus mayeri]
MWLSRFLAWLLLVAFFDWADAQDQNSFNDATSKQIWTLAYWTTSSTPQTCVPKYNPGYQVLNVVSVAGAPIFGQALAVITVSETAKQVHVHFRGPDAITTFIFSGYMYLLQSDFPVQPFEGMSVAQEFAKTFTALWQGGLREAINSAWDEYCDFPILITGHSVGSCMAQMFAVKIKKFGLWEYSKISLYAYESTRCGHQEFAMAVDASAQTRYQIRYNENCINLPPTTCTSLNTASPQACYWHPGYAVQYNKNIFGMTSGTIARCPTGETATCLSGNILTINNHNGFYALSYGLMPPKC